MKVKDIVKLTAFLLGKEDVVDYLEASHPTPSDELDKIISVMLKCLYVISGEISTEKYPLNYTETVSVTSGYVLYSTLTKTPYNIKSVKNSKGEEVLFVVKPDRIIGLDDYDTVSVEYAFIPSLKGINDNSDFSGTPITDRVLAYGICAEYRLYEGLYEEAYMWSEKYNTAIKSVLIPKKNLRIKGRDFI